LEWAVPTDTMSEMAAQPAPRVLFSFPNKIGASRICTTAWEQVRGAAAAGAEMTVHTGGVVRELPAGIRVLPTLERGRLRLPYRLVGPRRALALHDRIVARRLPALADDVDLIHAWPSGALETLRAAKKLGLPTVLERPNAHTRFAYEVVAGEAHRLGVVLPPDHEHAYNEAVLEREEEEFRLADFLLCPSDFVVQTFVDAGFAREKLLHHVYGFDQDAFRPDPLPRDASQPLTAIFVGVAAVRKGLHYALEAWLASPASERGRFLVAGEFLPSYRARLEPMLAHPSVEVLGHRSDVAELMRGSDVLLLPSIEEGFGLVCVEALGVGCIPLVSDACTEACRHLENALVHAVGDVAALTEHLTMLHENAELRASLRAGALRTAPEYTWAAAGVRLVECYRDALSSLPRSSSPAGGAPSG
jgi:glycosyltransferase involved in cell wall biosynthesis